MANNNPNINPVIDSLKTLARQEFSKWVGPKRFESCDVSMIKMRTTIRVRMEKRGSRIPKATLRKFEKLKERFPGCLREPTSGQILSEDWERYYVEMSFPDWNNEEMF